MIMDDFLNIADAMSITTSAASTDYIDTLAKGDDNVSPYFVVRVDTAFTSASANSTVEFKLQCDDNTSFTSAKNLWTSGAIAKASLVAGYFCKVRVPPGAERYLRGYVTVSVSAGTNVDGTAGKADMGFTKDADFNNQIE